MAWSLRPFIGSPDKPFEILRSDQGSNFYQAVGQAFIGLFDPEDSSAENRASSFPLGGVPLTLDHRQELQLEKDAATRDGWSPGQ